MKISNLLWNRIKGAPAATRAITAALFVSALTAHAGEASKPVAVVPPPDEPKVNFLLSVEFANEYVTPRGMIVRDSGLTVQPLLLMFVPVYKGDSFINSVKFVAGVWNDLGTAGVSQHPPYGSNPKTNWTEIDPIGGVSIGFAKNFTLDVTYTAFVEQILDIGTSQHLDIKLSFDDSEYLKAFALHPYVEFWQELQGKATDADVPYAVFGPSPKSGKFSNPGSSFYFDIGIDPSYTIKQAANLKIEAPCSVLLPNQRFYGEYYGNSSVVGLFQLGLKGTIPLDFMPKGYGHWSFFTGVNYQYYVDNNLYHLNTFNAPGQPTRQNWQVYAGLSAFF
jgi:hypothetical protein